MIPVCFPSLYSRKEWRQHKGRRTRKTELIREAEALAVGRDACKAELYILVLTHREQSLAQGSHQCLYLRFFRHKALLSHGRLVCTHFIHPAGHGGILEAFSTVTPIATERSSNYHENVVRRGRPVSLTKCHFVTAILTKAPVT